MLSPLDPRTPKNLTARVRLRTMYGAALGLLVGIIASGMVSFDPPQPWRGSVFLGRWILLGGVLGLVWGLWQERSRAQIGDPPPDEDSLNS